MSSGTSVSFKVNYRSTTDEDNGALKTCSIKPATSETIVSNGDWSLEYWEGTDAECRLTWTTNLALKRKLSFSRVVLTSTQASGFSESLIHDKVKSGGKACGLQWASKLRTEKYGSAMTLDVNFVLSSDSSGGPEKSKRLASWVPGMSTIAWSRESTLKFYSGVIESPQFFNVTFSFGDKNTLHSNSDFLSAASPYFKTLFSSGFSETSDTSSANSKTSPAGTVSSVAQLQKKRRRIMDDSDDEVDRPRLLPPPASYRVEVVDASYITYHEVLRWLHTGDISFAPLKSASPLRDLIQQTDDSAITFTPTDEAIPTFTPASPKSVYRLADFLELPELKALALDSILDQITVANVAVELISEVSQLYHPIQEALVDFAAKYWDEVKLSEGWKQLGRKVDEGEELSEPKIWMRLMNMLEKAK
ncbi:hypothetical protein P7C70_g7615, partial [Phenoliferia sp. Uapishka_3]